MFKQVEFTFKRFPKPLTTAKLMTKQQPLSDCYPMEPYKAESGTFKTVRDQREEVT